MPASQRRIAARRLVVIAAPLAAVVAALLLVTHTGNTPPAASTNRLAPPINDMTCDPTDHRDAPVTVHITWLVRGVAKDIPPDVGMSVCQYWLHTGRADGIVHADPPASVRHGFTLGDFFDVWHQPLGTEAVASDEGPVTSYVNGHRYTGNPRTIPLTDHTSIQLDVGQDVPPLPYRFPAGD